MTLRTLDKNNNVSVAYGDEPLKDYNGIAWYFKGYNFSTVFDHETDTHVVYKVTRDYHGANHVVWYTHITITNAMTMTIDDLYYYVMSEFLK